MTPRARIIAPSRVASGVPFSIRAAILHPMVTGHQLDAQGLRPPRQIITRFECHGEQGPMLAMNLHPAMAANPSIAFTISLERSSRLRLIWIGDAGFHHEASLTVDVG